MVATMCGFDAVRGLLGAASRGAGEQHTPWATSRQVRCKSAAVKKPVQIQSEALPLNLPHYAAVLVDADCDYPWFDFGERFGAGPGLVCAVYLEGSCSPRARKPATGG